jgi:2-keto-4-pentenoate hydratase
MRHDAQPLMNNPNHESAAQFLLAARKRGTPGPRIPAEFRPKNDDDALAIQARVTELVGQPIGGYKCSLPTGLRPVFMAPIFAPTISDVLPFPVRAVGSTALIEPEIAFVMARDLPKRATAYSDDEIRDAIKEARLVLEVLGSRYSDPASVTFSEVLAEGIRNQGLFVGPVLRDPWNQELEAFSITISTGTRLPATYEGKHEDRHPARPLYWLANYLAMAGTPLAAGMIVTTGSYCGAIDVPLDTPLTFTYGDLGTLQATLTRA